MNEAKNIHDDRRRLINEAQQIIENAERENRSITPEESDRFKKCMNEAQEMKKRIEDIHAGEERDREARSLLEQAETWERESRGRRTDLESGDQDRPRFVEYRGCRIPLDPRVDSQTYRSAIASFLLKGSDGLSPYERRALSAGDGPEGGFLLGMQMAAELAQKLDDLLFVRRYARVIPVSGSSSLGVPTIENEMADADWTGETTTVTADSTLDFGQRELVPNTVTKSLLVSRKLLRGAAFAVEDIVRERISYKFAVTQEKAFLTGTGASQPLGIFTASATGISTSRDVNDGNTTTAIVADNLRANKYSIKQQYRRQGFLRWIFHRDAVLDISQLKDGNSQYLWRPGITDSDPDTLLGIPIDESEYAPNTFTTGQYVGALAYWPMYWIADSLMMEIQRADELYAATNQVGFFVRGDVDGMPIHEEAFSRVTLA